MADIEFIDNSDEILRLLAGATMKAAKMVGMDVAGIARDNCMPKGPKGEEMAGGVELREDINYRVEDTDDGPMLMVGSKMQSAPYIELGTGKEYDPPEEWIKYHANAYDGHVDKHSKAGLDEWVYYDENDKKFKIGMPIPAQPYLRPAFMDHVDDIKATIREALENA